MRNMYANRVTRGGGSTFLHGKGRESAMTASLGFKRSCDYCNKSGHKKTQCPKVLRIIIFERRGKKQLVKYA